MGAGEEQGLHFVAVEVWAAAEGIVQWSIWLPWKQ